MSGDKRQSSEWKQDTAIGLQRERTLLDRVNLLIKRQPFIGFQLLQLGPHAAGPMGLEDVLMTLHPMVFRRPKLEIIRERA